MFWELTHKRGVCFYLLWQRLSKWQRHFSVQRPMIFSWVLNLASYCSTVVVVETSVYLTNLVKLGGRGHTWWLITSDCWRNLTHLYHQHTTVFPVGFQNLSASTELPLAVQEDKKKNGWHRRFSLLIYSLFILYHFKGPAKNDTEGFLGGKVTPPPHPPDLIYNWLCQEFQGSQISKCKKRQWTDSLNVMVDWGVRGMCVHTQTNPEDLRNVSVGCQVRDDWSKTKCMVLLICEHLLPAKCIYMHLEIYASTWIAQFKFSIHTMFYKKHWG